MHLPWIRVDVTIVGNPKLAALEDLVGLTATTHLVHLWLAVAQHRPRGDLTGVSDRQIETWSRWRRTVGRLANALRQTGWLDGVEGASSVHDWIEYQGYRAEKAQRDATAKKTARAVRAPTATARSCAALTTDGTERTVRNETEERDPERSLSLEQKTTTGLPAGIRDRTGFGGRTLRARTVFGLVEDEHRPKDHVALEERYRVDLTQRFPALVADPVVLRDELLARFAPYTRSYQESGPDVARAKLFSWLEEAEAAQARKARGKKMASKFDGEHVVSDGKAALWQQWRNEHPAWSKGDPDGFEEWKAQQTRKVAKS